jgi:hypothetical protein
MMMNDAWVIAFCEDLDIPGERLMQARAALPGFDHMNWT